MADAWGGSWGSSWGSSWDGTYTPPVVTTTTPTLAGGVSKGGKRKRRVMIGDRLYEVDSLKDVEFLLKRVVRTHEVAKPAAPRKVVKGKVSAKAEAPPAVTVQVPYVTPDWSGLYKQLEEQDAAYARALVRALERAEEDDIETLLLWL